jgi:hypothetical protein
MRRMTESNWYVATHGDRVVLTLPAAGESDASVFDMSASEAAEMAGALAEAAEALGSADPG